MSHQDPSHVPPPPTGSAPTLEPAVALRSEQAPGTARRIALPVVILLGVVGIVLTGQALFHRANEQTNHVALSSSAKGVTVAIARHADFRPTRRYIGAIQPWIEAQVGPQLVSAYASTVLVRPGAVVHRGDVLATLDCREASAESQALAQQARAIQANQAALERQAQRVAGLLDGGYVAQNDVDQRQAESASEQARLLATRARMAGTNLYVSDCVMRAPFDGEIGARMIDPGAFVRPGTAVVSEVDRSIVRITADVPETDFAAVAPNTVVQLHVLATDRRMPGTITRRSPSADPATRTIHIEIDLPDSQRELPVNTTAEIMVDVGQPVPAAQIPLTAADVNGARASIFVVQDGVAHARRVHVLGEAGGQLFVDPSLAEGTQLVTEGRATLVEGDRVRAQTEGTGFNSPGASVQERGP